MPSALVPIADMLAFLGDVPEDQASIDLLTRLVDHLEATFLAQCGRTERPFQAAEAGRVEVRDGTGDRTLWLDYDASALTEIVLGFDFTDPDETLDVSDPLVLTWQAGKNRITRRDGGHFGCVGEPEIVRVTYDAADDLPADVAEAITRVVATIWRQRGSEDVSADRIGPYDATYLAIAEKEPLWQMAVAAHREVHV